MKTAFRTEARVLRRRGHSLGELSRRFDISKSTASLWTSDVIPSQLGIDIIKKKREASRAKGHAILHEAKVARLAKAEAEADALFAGMTRNRLLDLAILSMIYQCEGTKDDKGLRFTNSDPNLVKLFLGTFRSSFCIDESRLRVRVHIHDYHNESEILVFWSYVTDIPLAQFYRSFRKPSNHTYKKEGYKGCVHIMYYDSHVARVVKSFAKKLINLYI